MNHPLNIIDTKNLQIVVCLAADAFQTLVKIGSRVVNRDDDGDERSIHHGAEVAEEIAPQRIRV